MSSQTSTSAGAPAQPATDAGNAGLPHGWRIEEYRGKGGRPHFAVYAHGRRLVAGMTNLESASRWAHLMASSQPWLAA